MEKRCQIDKSKLAVMNFLNEISIDYPEAISFASGRPTEKYFHLDDWLEKIPIFIEYFAQQNNFTTRQAYKHIAQYGRTTGIINELVSQQVENDENIVCLPEDIIITAGAQEAMVLSIQSLFQNEDEVLLVCDPTYIGIIGVAFANNVQLQFLNNFSSPDFLGMLEEVIDQMIIDHKIPKAIYVIPDFDNPTGEVMPLEMRAGLIKLCCSHEITILEDNPYGLFRYEGVRLPTLYEMDYAGVVIYIGTYSKTLCPSIRIGFIITPQIFQGNIQRTMQLKKSISDIKSFLTVNTSQIMQALVGGILLDNNISLQNLITQPLEHYRSNRDCIISILDDIFRNESGVSWNTPQGGFFLGINLPFPFREKESIECVKKSGVICMPLSFFSFGRDYDNSVRLAFSNLEQDEIESGIHRFTDYIFASK